MLQNMEVWTEVRRALFVEKISKRETSRRFGFSYYLITKISSQASPGIYHRASPPHRGRFLQTKLTKSNVSLPVGDSVPSRLPKVENDWQGDPPMMRSALICPHSVHFVKSP